MSPAGELVMPRWWRFPAARTLRGRVAVAGPALVAAAGVLAVALVMTWTVAAASTLALTTGDGGRTVSVPLGTVITVHVANAGGPPATQDTTLFSESQAAVSPQGVATATFRAIRVGSGRVVVAVRCPGIPIGGCDGPIWFVKINVTRGTPNTSGVAVSPAWLSTVTFMLAALLLVRDHKRPSLT